MWVYAIKHGNVKKKYEARNVQIKIKIKMCVSVNKFSRNLMFHCYKLNAAIVLVGQSICCHCRRRRHRYRNGNI